MIALSMLGINPMEVTATEARNRFGQVLDACQREPVFIGKSGRRHGVRVSTAHCDALWNEDFRTR